MTPADRYSRTLLCAAVLLLGLPGAGRAAPPEAFPGTEPLTWGDDPAARLLDAADAFLMRQLEASVGSRSRFWNRDVSSPGAYERSLAPNRERLRHILGVRGERPPFGAPELVATVDRKARIASGDGYEILAIRWPGAWDTRGTGLLLQPVGRDPVADVIALPHCDLDPEQIAGLDPPFPEGLQFARRLAESGCRVVVPVLIKRTEQVNGITAREWLYRPAYQLGRHLIGYEVQKVLAIIDWFAADTPGRPIGVMGSGDGGMIALYAGALDSRLRAVGVSGYFQSRQTLWEQPLDRNVFGLLEQFGDAELASMIAPRNLVVEMAGFPDTAWAHGFGAPARIRTPPEREVLAEIDRARGLVDARALGAEGWLVGVRREAGDSMEAALEAFSGRLGVTLAPPGSLPVPEVPLSDPDLRQARQVEEIDRATQRLLRRSPRLRKEFTRKLFDASRSVATYTRVADQYRDRFAREVIGVFDMPLDPPRPRTRKVFDEAGWTGYEVVLDVFDGVFTYGLLLVPRNLQPGERRPVVVCQHGLEGRPRQLVTGDHRAYRNFAARLADEGYVVFAPQNLYVLGDRFRVLQRKANPLGKTLFSIMVPQHRQLARWLASLDFVDPERIAYYGLSYGGKSVMRITPLVDRYALAICSGDFNDWIWKTASSDSPYSNVNGGEYEVFEFNAGRTFGYAEMAALIAPRPFMVERGHQDETAPDERVAFEFAKVRRLYAALLGLEDRTRIEWFNGPHAINAEGSFEFLNEQFDWPAP